MDHGVHCLPLQVEICTADEGQGAAWSVSMFRMLGISLASSNEQNNHFMYFVLFCWYLYIFLPIIYIYIHTITQVIFQFNMQAPPFSAFKINGHIFRILPGILNCFFQAFLERPRSSRLENDRKTIATEVEGP